MLKYKFELNLSNCELVNFCYYLRNINFSILEYSTITKIIFLFAMCTLRFKNYLGWIIFIANYKPINLISYLFY